MTQHLSPDQRLALASLDRPRRGISAVPELIRQVQIVGLPEPVTELRFHPVRRWKFDLCFVEAKLAVECEGGVYQNGRHSRGKGFEADCEKYAHAAIMGYTVLRVTPRQIHSGIAVQWIERLIQGRM